MKQVALIIVFNHKYNMNLEKLRKMYAKRFSYIRFLVPFYEGFDDDVIPVYENSFQFQGYFAQGLFRYAKEDASYYVFIGDDLILNPELNEENICEYLALGENDSYIESLTPLASTMGWSYQRFADAELAFAQIGASYKNEIPDKEEALKIAQKYNNGSYSLRNAKFHNATKKKQIIGVIKSKLRPLSLDYPLMTAYSDFLVISQKDIYEFARLCGVFASMRLWVEIAAPTAMMLACGSIKMQNDISLKTDKMWKLSDSVESFEKKCDYKLSNIERLWPKDYAYLHPIKLSKWKD